MELTKVIADYSTIIEEDGQQNWTTCEIFQRGDR